MMEECMVDIRTDITLAETDEARAHFEEELSLFQIEIDKLKR